MNEYIEKESPGIVPKAFVVDDQGLEVSYTSLKPSKERRFSDIILIQYSKSTQTNSL